MNHTEATAWAPAAPLDRGNAAHQILEDLRLQILDGRFPRGARLPTEKQLAQGYQVSGPTVREAIRGLTTSGLVEVRHGSGAYVTGEAHALMDAPLRSMIQMEKVGVAEVLGVLKALNCHAAELAAMRASSAELDAIRAALAALDTATSAPELSSRLIAFLQALAGASGNPLLAVLCSFLARIQVDLASELSGGTFESWRKTVRRLAKERGRVVDAIASRDAQAAWQAAAQYHDKAAKVITALPLGNLVEVRDPMLASLIRAHRERDA